VYPGPGGPAACIAAARFHDEVAATTPDLKTGCFFGTASTRVTDVHVELPNGDRIAGQLHPLGLGPAFPQQFFVLSYSRSGRCGRPPDRPVHVQAGHNPIRSSWWDATRNDDLAATRLSACSRLVSRAAGSVKSSTRPHEEQMR